ncbi:MAG: dual specificity protein phosphatase family protein [Spirochaetia bacterium]|nr:dual specificity protein phosphatase family protein [Spirochaetia bacterium]
MESRQGSDAGPGGAAALPPVPIPFSYWVLPGRLLAGEYPGHATDAVARARIGALLDAGVRSFVDLTEERDGLEPYDALLRELSGGAARHLKHGIRDVSVPRRKADMVAILDAVDAELAEGRAVYVHCWGGVGRTGTVVGCWIARHYGDSGRAVPWPDGSFRDFAALWAACPKAAYRQSPETPEQRDFVARWRE